MQRCQIIASFNDKMMFGKYKGKSIRNIDEGYLKWMWENGYIKCTKGFFSDFKKFVLSYQKPKKYMRYITEVEYDLHSPEQVIFRGIYD